MVAALIKSVKKIVLNVSTRMKSRCAKSGGRRRTMARGKAPRKPPHDRMNCHERGIRSSLVRRLVNGTNAYIDRNRAASTIVSAAAIGMTYSPKFAYLTERPMRRKIREFETNAAYSQKCSMNSRTPRDILYRP